MHFQGPGLYHVFNRGNNQHEIFSNVDDYHVFLEYSRKYLLGKADILAWCLMPNHFHLMLDVGESGLTTIKWGGNEMSAISNGIQLLQSSYAKRKNIQTGSKGSLFQQRAKSKFIESDEYARICFWYIHFNPVAAKIVENMADWPYSSYRSFIGLKEDILLNKNRAQDILGFSSVDFAYAPVAPYSFSLPWVV